MRKSNRKRSAFLLYDLAVGNVSYYSGSMCWLVPRAAIGPLFWTTNYYSALFDAGGEIGAAAEDGVLRMVFYGETDAASFAVAFFVGRIVADDVALADV
jgi:hypothetical protein